MKVRRQIAWEAARLMYWREEQKFHRAKVKAARGIRAGRVRSADLPSDAEVHDQVVNLARLMESAQPTSDRMHQMRLRALWWMEEPADRWQVFRALLLPLEQVEQDPRYHPEGDALYHSLQVFAVALEEMPYDEDFLLAALLHEVGKAIDARDPVAAGLDALDGFVTDRTEWLIAHLSEGRDIVERRIGVRRRRALRRGPWFDDLVCLAECDLEGRAVGVRVPEVDEALETIRSLGTMFG